MRQKIIQTQNAPASFPMNPPARSVAKLGVDLPGLLVSIRMTAYAGSNPQR
jgi:hypothetical protein